MIEKRCFLQWFALTLSYAVGAFFAWQNGLIGDVWAVDATHMTAVIAAMFVVTVGYIGFASWRYDRNPLAASADIGLGHYAGAAVIYVGLIGTVIGLMRQLQALASVDPADPASGLTFLGVTGKALGTAFYATGAGLVAALLIGFVVANLNYFLERDEI